MLHAFFFRSYGQFLLYELLQIVNVWDMRKYSSKKTIPTYEMIEAVTFIGSGSGFLACLGVKPANINEKTDGYFLTVGERGVVRIWNLERYIILHLKVFLSLHISILLYMQPMTFLVFNSGVCIFEQQSSDVTINSENEESRRGFTSAIMLPNDQGLLCVTADQQFLFYSARTDKGTFQLNLYRRLIGYNDEILDLKFIGEDEQYLAVATNLEQVR